MGVARFDYLSVPDCDVFAILGRHYPSAGGVAHFVVWRLVRGLSESPAGCFYRSFRGFACRATNCCRIRPGNVWLHSWQLLLAELGTLALVWYIVLAVPVPVLIYKQLLPDLSSTDCRYLVGGRYQTCEYPLPWPGNIELTGLFAALSVMFWCLSVWKHLPILPRNLKIQSVISSCFDDWPAAGRISLLGRYGVVLHFDAYGEQMAAAASLPKL